MFSFPPQSPTPHIISDADYDQHIRTLCSNLKQVPYGKLVGDVSERGGFLEVSFHSRRCATLRFSKSLVELI